MKALKMSLYRFASTLALATAIVLTPLAGHAPVAHAQTPAKLDSNIQGTVGLGLIGAEVGLVLPAVIGMDGAWPYIVFPVALGGGGAAAGYFAMDKGDHTTAGIVTLGVGVALIIPAVVATVALTAYSPGDAATKVDDTKNLPKKDFGDSGADAVGDAPAAAPTNGAPVAEPPAAAPAPDAPAPAAPTPAPAPQASMGLIRYQPNGAVLIGIPAISMANSYTDAEVSRYGVTQRAELRVPVLSGSF